MTPAETDSYRVAVTIHDVERPTRQGSDLAAALSEAGLAAHAIDVRSDTESNDVVVVFGGLEAAELPQETDAQDPEEADALRHLGVLREQAAALLPAIRALLALGTTRDREHLPPHRHMSIEVEPS